MTQPTSLTPLRSRLKSLQSRRAMVRWLNAGAALLASLLVVVLLVFAVDWSFEPGNTGRVILWVVGGVMFLTAFLMFVRPWLGHQETLEDLALEVERHHDIDSDLVAAMQFESADSPAWGSTQLAGAVISYVAEFSPNLDVFEGFTWKKLEQRAGLLAVVVLVTGLLLFFVPLHVKTFGQRMLFGNLHYPTKTHIDQIEINGVVAFPSERVGLSNPPGKPLIFRVTGSGELPVTGRVELKSLRRDIVVELPLEKIEENTSGDAVYAAELPKLVDSVSWQVFLGDAWTEPRIVELIPLPVVSVQLTPESPQYILETGDENNKPREGAWQLAVVESSNVHLSLRCTNKSLKSAWVTIGEQQYPLTGPPAGEEKKTGDWAEGLVGKVGEAFTSTYSPAWTLPVAGTPLEDIQEPVRYEIQVEDVDGLQLPKPLQGYIGLKTDKPPRIGAAIAFSRYIAKGKPRIEFGAADDYGLAKLLLRVELVQQNPDAQLPPPKEIVREIPIPRKGNQLTASVRDTYELKLKELTGFFPAPTQTLFEKGDQLKITLEAIDYRGQLPGESKVSEPLVITITDRIGLGADLNDTTRLSAKQINAIIQQELGIGASQ